MGRAVRLSSGMAAGERLATVSTMMVVPTRVPPPPPGLIGGVRSTVAKLVAYMHVHPGEFGHCVWRDLLLALLGEAENVVGTATAVCVRHSHEAAVRAC